MKKITACIFLALTSNAFAENGRFNTIIKPEKGFVYTNQFFEVEGDWEQVSGLSNCTTWTPDTETIKQGTSFDQSRHCDVTEEKVTEHYGKLSDGTEYLIKTEKETRSSNSEFTQTAIGTDFYSILLSLTSQQNTDVVNMYDKTQTSHPQWEHNFGLTKDFALTASSYANQTINADGYVNWFDPDQTYRMSVMKACYALEHGSDKAVSHIRYLDKDNNIVFWTKSFDHESKAPYGTHFTYGKAADESDVHYTGTGVATWPYVDGNIKFDKENGTVSFNNLIQNTSYSMENWTLSGVDVKSITRIQLVSSNVVTLYTGGTCGANVRLYIEDDAED